MYESQNLSHLIAKNILFNSNFSSGFFRLIDRIHPSPKICITSKELFSFYHASNLSVDERAHADELSSLISQMGYDAPLINDQSNDLKQKNYESKKRDEALHWIHSTRKQVFIKLMILI